MAYSNNYEWRNLVDHDQKLAFEAIEIVHKRADSYKPFDRAVDTLWEVYESGQEILYIGARKEIHNEVTLEFLSFNGFPEGELICADPSKGKLGYLTECQYLIDDRPRTIFEFLYDKEWEGDSRKAFALWRPYNQNLTDLKGLYLAPTWGGLRYYLKKKGVITID